MKCSFQSLFRLDFAINLIWILILETCKYRCFHSLFSIKWFQIFLVYFSQWLKVNHILHEQAIYLYYILKLTKISIFFILKEHEF